MEWRKRGDRRAGEGAREKRSLSWPCLCSVQLMGGTLGSPSSPSPHLPGKVLVQHVLAHEISKTAHLCG